MKIFYKGKGMLSLDYFLVWFIHIGLFMESLIFSLLFMLKNKWIVFINVIKNYLYDLSVLAEAIKEPPTTLDVNRSLYQVASMENLAKRVGIFKANSAFSYLNFFNTFENKDLEWYMNRVHYRGYGNLDAWFVDRGDDPVKVFDRLLVTHYRLEQYIEDLYAGKRENAHDRCATEMDIHEKIRHLKHFLKDFEELIFITSSMSFEIAHYDNAERILMNKIDTHKLFETFGYDFNKKTLLHIRKFIRYTRLYRHRNGEYMIRGNERIPVNFDLETGVALPSDCFDRDGNIIRERAIKYDNDILGDDLKYDVNGYYI